MLKYQGVSAKIWACLWKHFTFSLFPSGPIELQNVTIFFSVWTQTSYSENSLRLKSWYPPYSNSSPITICPPSSVCCQCWVAKKQSAAYIDSVQYQIKCDGNLLLLETIFHNFVTFIALVGGSWPQPGSHLKLWNILRAKLDFHSSNW